MGYQKRKLLNFIDKLPENHKRKLPGLFLFPFTWCCWAVRLQRSRQTGFNSVTKSIGRVGVFSPADRRYSPLVYYRGRQSRQSRQSRQDEEDHN